MAEVSRNFRNIFFPKYHQFWKLKLNFCSLKKDFEFFCRNIVNHVSMNKVWPKFQDFCGTFFFPKYPRFWKLKLDFFSKKKRFFQIFQNTQHFFHLNFISKKSPEKSENIPLRFSLRFLLRFSLKLDFYPL